jgi:hypothetical protein
VFVEVKNAARRRPVRVIAAGEDQMEVTSGLSGAEKIILDPSGLEDADAIKPLNAAEATPAGAGSSPQQTPRAEAVP